MGFVLRRQAARVLCFDPQGRLLLIHASDPADRSKPPWWELPGGGIDPGERPEDAILRELREEAGITSATVGPCVWTQHAQFQFGGWDFDQHERIHIATSDGDTSGALRLEALEAMSFSGERWWPTDELLASEELTIPPRLREFLPQILELDDQALAQFVPVDISPSSPSL
jgi:8-oxo-dGTP pyrophosphatase MutT (NUDIX family)